jgi:molybdenum cofactor synthesis domain-containing protein
MEPARTLRDVSCADDYDPNSLPVERARALIREFLAPVTAVERVHIRAALGRVLAADVLSPIDVPGHDNSAMDGWAVRFADLDPAGTTLRRVGESFAGKPFAGALGRGEAVRIFTGGVMPPGADTVVMQERASVTADGVRIAAGAVSRAGQNRRFAGEDVKRGTTVLRAGHPVRPAEIGVLASLGIAEATVYRRLRVAFFSTGDELRALGETLGAGEVYDSNRYTLYGMLTRLGQNRRLAGEDMKRGAIVFRAGQPVRPAELGMLASIGVGECTVYRRLRVAFFSTGDELRSIGQPLAAGEVYDSNRYTLYGMLTRLNCDVVDMGVVPDVPDALERALTSAAATADVVITSGGVSVGEADFVRDLLARLGEVLFWKIAMKPGRPLAYGRIGSAHFFGLPGNPVAVMVTFYNFVRDALLTLQGRSDVAPMPAFKATLANPIRKAPGRTEFQRGILTANGTGGYSVRTTGEQGSGILSSMAQANCFIVLPVDAGNLEPGTPVDVQVLEGLV